MTYFFHLVFSRHSFIQSIPRNWCEVSPCFHFIIRILCNENFAQRSWHVPPGQFQYLANLSSYKPNDFIRIFFFFLASIQQNSFDFFIYYMFFFFSLRAFSRIWKLHTIYSNCWHIIHWTFNIIDLINW